MRLPPSWETRVSWRGEPRRPRLSGMCIRIANARGDIQDASHGWSVEECMVLLRRIRATTAQDPEAVIELLREPYSAAGTNRLSGSS